MNNTHTISRSFFWSFLEQGGSRIIVLVVQLVLARLLSPEVFGVMAILLVCMEIMNVFSQSGLGMALIQNSRSTQDSFTTAFWLSMGLSIGVYALVFILAPFVAAFYAMSELTLCLRVLSIAVFLNALCSIQRSYLQKQMDFKALFRSNIVAAFIAGAIAIIAACFGWGIWALILQVILQALVSCILMFLLVPWRPKLSFCANEAKELFSYGWKICATGILNVLYTGLSELIIGKTCSTADLGYYSQGRKWPQAGIAMVSNAVQNVMFPAFSKIKDDIELFRNSVRKALVVASWLSVPFCVFVAVAAGPIVVLLLGDVWRPCTPVFQLVCLGAILDMVQIINLRSYMALGDSRLYMYLQIIKVGIGIILICGTALISQNIYWVAFATCFTAIMNIIIVDMQPAKRMFGVSRKEQIKLLLPVIVLAFCCGAIAWPILLIDLPSLVTLLLQAVVFGVGYLGGSKVLRLQGLAECKKLLKKSKAQE